MGIVGGAKYWKTATGERKKRPEVPQGLGHAIYPECFSSAPVNHTFLIEYAKKMFFCASPRTVHTL